MTQSDQDPPSALRRLWPLGLLAVCALLAGWALSDRLSYGALQENYAVLERMRDGAYAATVLGFVAVYAVVVALSLPGATVATLTGGFLFGVWPGVVFNVMGATAGATVKKHSGHASHAAPAIDLEPLDVRRSVERERGVSWRNCHN